MIPFSGSSGPAAADAYRRAVRRYQFSHGVKYVCYGLVLPGRLKAYLPVDSPPAAATTAHFVPPMSIPMYFFVLIFSCLHSSIDSSSFVSFCLTLSSFFATTDA